MHPFWFPLDARALERFCNLTVQDFSVKGNLKSEVISVRSCSSEFRLWMVVHILTPSLFCFQHPLPSLVVYSQILSLNSNPCSRSISLSLTIYIPSLCPVTTEAMYIPNRYLNLSIVDLSGQQDSVGYCSSWGNGSGSISKLYPERTAWTFPCEGGRNPQSSPSSVPTLQ